MLISYQLHEQQIICNNCDAINIYHHKEYTSLPVCRELLWVYQVKCEVLHELIPGNRSSNNFLKNNSSE